MSTWSFWDDTATPATDPQDDPTALTLGLAFSCAVAGTVTGVRFYKGAGDSATHTIQLWGPTGTLLGSGTATGETSSGWQVASFDTPVAISAGVTYTVSYFTPNGIYAFTGSYFTAARTAGPLTAAATNNGRFAATDSAPAEPDQTFNSTNYWVDPIVTVADPPALSASMLLGL